MKALKKTLLKKFAADNHMSSDSINRAFDKHKFSALAKKDKLDGDDGGAVGDTGKLNFEAWCDLFECEGTGEYRKLFGLYDHQEDETIDFKEFMLALNNFASTDKDTKIRFAFQLFDEDRSGVLSEAELIGILKANHMQSEQAVMKKVRTIMAQADDDGDGTINYDEFVVIARKFPNILFPTMN